MDRLLTEPSLSPNLHSHRPIALFRRIHSRRVLLYANVVCSWGRGEDGQLGHGDTVDRLFPTQLSALDAQHIVSLVCGAGHTIAYSHSRVQVYSWGCEAECYKIDPKNNKVYCRASHDKQLGGKEEFSLDYDYLVIAMGARSNTFNTPGVEEHAYFLKEVEDAQRMRHKVINLFERPSLPSVSVEEKKKLLSFVIVGGGPTGVEFAIELHDFVHEDLSNLYPSLKDHVKITLLEAGDHILNILTRE